MCRLCEAHWLVQWLRHKYGLFWLAECLFSYLPAGLSTSVVVDGFVYSHSEVLVSQHNNILCPTTSTCLSHNGLYRNRQHAQLGEYDRLISDKNVLCMNDCWSYLVRCLSDLQLNCCVVFSRKNAPIETALSSHAVNSRQQYRWWLNGMRHSWKRNWFICGGVNHN